MPGNFENFNYLCISRSPSLCLCCDPGPCSQFVFTCPCTQFFIYRSWPSICICKVLAPNLCLPTVTETLHLPALVPKLYLPALTPAMAPNLYLPVQGKILLLLTQLLVLSLPLLLPPPLLLQLLLLPLKIITRSAFAAAKSALNGP